MKRIFAPWRMEYILKSRESGCFLCDIFQSDQDRSNLVLKRGETGVVLMNKYPYNNGHLMVAPYRHVDTLEAMSGPEMTELMTLTSWACGRLQAAIHPEGFNVGLNLGAAAGAGLKDHLHLHIVPRWTGDTNFLPVLAEVKIIPQSFDDLWQKLQQP